MLQNVAEFWRRMRFGQRMLLVTVLLACGGAVAVLVGWARQPEMALLYSDLAPEEASRIVEKIRDLGIAYEVKGGGTAVYVPVESKYTIWLELAGEGLPTGDNPGYRILDEEKIGTGPFTQRINYTRAMEGELAKTISLIEGVAGARVHIVRPTSNLFRQDQKGATATVALRLRPGWHLAPGAVAAIIHLVSHSVENLQPQDVAVIDSAGSLLSGGADGPMARGIGTLFDYKSQVEEYLAAKAEKMLTTVLGPGRAIVRVHADIETSSVDQTVEKYEPDAKVATKEELVTKSETPGAGGTAAGAPGTEAPAGNLSKEETVTTDYLVSRTTSKTLDMPGKITSVSVSAFVDLSAPEPAAGDAAKPAAGAEGGAAPATAAPTLTVDDVKKVIQNTLGLKDATGLTVVSVPFRRPDAAAEPEDPGLFASPQFYMDLARHGSLGVLVVGALLVLKMFGGSKRRPAAAPAAGGELQPAGQGQSVNLLAGAGEDPEQLRQRIATALQDNPEEVKRLFRTWVDGGQGEA